MMYGELRNFDSGFSMSQHLSDAAIGPVNTVTREAFQRDLNVASSMTISDTPLQAIDSTPIKHSGGAPLADASGAGYNGSKSAYIESNKGGYQARSRAHDVDIPPARPEAFMPESNPSIRMSSYRRNHLKTVTRGLRALS